ncbi:hypothetical protein PhaeoP72_01059 [Phaeobacter inhibens]|nr:hypothetical protein PhaeoP72_01059 [Phaeobacter inhibens]
MSGGKRLPVGRSLVRKPLRIALRDAAQLRAGP